MSKVLKMSKFNSDAESLVIDEEAQDDAPLRKAMVTKENNSDSDTNEEIDVVTLDDVSLCYVYVSIRRYCQVFVSLRYAYVIATSLCYYC